MRKKIIFIQPSFAHYRYDLFEELDNLFDVTFVFVNKNKTSEYQYPSTTKVNSKWKVKYLYGEFNRFWFWNLYKLLIKTNPEAVVCSIPGSIQSIVTSIAKKIKKIPFVLYTESWSDNRINNKNICKRLVRKCINKFVLNSVSCIVCGGTRSQEYYSRIGFDNKKIFKAYQCTHDVSQHPTDLTFKKKKQVNILYFSRIVTSKGLDVLIKAFSNIHKSYPDICLTIVGDGPEKNKYEILAQNENIDDIPFVGAVNNEDAYQYYYQSDIYVLPCNGVGRGEAWGLVLNEATSMSLPIITTNVVGATGDLVINGLNGYVIEANDIGALEEALIKLICSEELRKKMGQESRKLFDRINNPKKSAYQFLNAIQSMNL